MPVGIRRVFLAIALLAACLACGTGHAAEPGAQAQNDALSLLMADQFAELDRRFGAIQQQYKDGTISDESLRAAFRVFYTTDAELEPHYEAWVRESPNSYVAICQGIYYKKLGAERRGGGFISETSDKQLAGMEAANEVAYREFAASLTLDNKPLLTYLHSIDLRTDVGDKAGARRLLDAAVGIDPKNFIAREKYMGSLQTRWGGSVEEMRSFLKECRAAGISAAHLRDLEALVVEDEAWVHRYQDGDAQAAARDYQRAARLYPALRTVNPAGR